MSTGLHKNEIRNRVARLSRKNALSKIVIRLYKKEGLAHQKKDLENLSPGKSERVRFSLELKVYMRSLLFSN